MRSFSTPEQRRKSSESTPLSVSQTVSPATSVTVTSLHATPPVTPIVSASTPMLSTSDTDKTMAGLEAENASLKIRVEELDLQLRCAIDHTIENDARLLRYTNEIFSTSTISTNTMPIGVTVVPQASESPIRAECAVQCDLTPNHDHGAYDLSLIDSLKTTIQVLEAEVECLRAETANCTCKNDGPWLQYTNKRGPPIKLHNQFKSLNCIGDSEKTYRAATTHQATDCRAPRTKNNISIRPLPKQIYRPTSGSNRPCKHLSVTIESDSHGRHIAGMVKDIIGPGNKVTGMCKPGAGLLDVASSKLPGNDISVIIAGTNDIARGTQHTIFQHLERLVTGRLKKSSKVVVATLPHRHDLPRHHAVHQQTLSVNRLISEVAARHVGVKVLDFNKIPRRLFTRHGMHLRMPGKRLLAGRLVQCLDHFTADGTSSLRTLTTSSVVPSVGSCVSTEREPFMLPYDSYAEALRRPKSPVHSSVATHCADEDLHFLEKTFSKSPVT